MCGGLQGIILRVGIRDQAIVGLRSYTVSVDEWSSISGVER